MGYEVISCDLYPESSQRALGKPPYLKVDLNRGLPFRDEAFQYIILAESIQLIDNYRSLLGEFNRVLKKGGLLILSLPNVLSLPSRVSFLLRGYFPSFKPFRTIREDRPWDSVVFNPVSLVELYQLLKKNAFEIEGVSTSLLKPKDLTYLPLWWLARLGTAIADSRGRGEERRLLRFLTSRAALLGRTLVIRCRKV